MNDNFLKLKNKLLEVEDLKRAAYVLSWDQSTYMPPAGAKARARHSATLERLAQEKFTDPEIGRILDALRPYEESLPYDSDEASLIRITRQDYERMTRIPTKFIGELSEHSIQTYSLWAEARPENNFAKVRPNLEKTLELSRQLANFFPGYDHIIDPLIDFSDPGIKSATLTNIFSDLRKELVPMVKAITSQPPADDSCLHQFYPQETQLQVSKELVSKLGYDFSRGRLDLTHHPFETAFSVGDVRITTRVKEKSLDECLYGVIHEGGHAMYEQGVAENLDGTPLGSGTSSGVHESQSRLWENLVGRSREFIEFAYPILYDAFPSQLSKFSAEDLYVAVNKVEKSLIRTSADEVTYNLHVMLRFDLEMKLLDGRLEVKDLPEAWRQRYEQDLGIIPPDDKDGCMQDVHWYGGVIGGVFQGYTLGNILGALFFQIALQKDPNIPNEIRLGQFNKLHQWLKENIYQHGRKFTTNELVERISGDSVQIAPYIAYLKKKYGELYKLND